MNYEGGHRRTTPCMIILIGRIKITETKAVFKYSNNCTHVQTQVRDTNARGRIHVQTRAQTRVRNEFADLHTQVHKKDNSIGIVKTDV